MDLETINKAASETNLETIVGPVSFNEDHVALMSCVTGQWVMNEDGTYRQEIVGNYLMPDVDITADVILIPKNSQEGELMRALIIEDDRILSNNICESLNHKFEMVQAFDGEEGLDRLFKEEFDVVILDVMMPRVNGYEVLEQMRESGNNTPVLMLTALNQPADQVKGLRGELMII
jgi:CheY-like chemotaxis protein